MKYKFEYNIDFISELKGHNGPITSLVCSEDKNGVPLLFSGSEDTSIIVWKLNFKEGTSEKDKYSNQNETIIKSKIIIKKHNNFITSLSLNSDNTQLISSSLDNSIIIWDINHLNPDSIINVSKSIFLSAIFNPDNPDDSIIISSDKKKKLKYYNSKGNLIYCDKNLDVNVTCFLNIKKNKKNYFAVGLSDGRVKIYDDNFALYREIPIYNQIKYDNNKLQSKEEESISVASLTIDDEGEYLFIGYRNGIIRVNQLTENIPNDEEENCKEIMKIGVTINNILFENKYFMVLFIGTNKGLKIKKIKGEIIYEDNSSPCLSLCFDKNKNYLFAGYKNGIIRVYNINN